MSVIETIHLGDDPINPGVTEYMHYDHATDEFYLESVQDCDAVVESAKAHASQFDERTPWRLGHMNLVAQIPTVLYIDLLRKGIAQDQKALKRWLNDPDNRLFRTRPGRL